MVLKDESTELFENYWLIMEEKKYNPIDKHTHQSQEKDSSSVSFVDFE